MPDTVNGLPVHPLVVHAVVVLLPLAALGVVALAVRPSWRGRYGVLVVAVAALATAAIPLATESGESLEARVGDPGRHAELGDTLIWFALPLLLAAVALFWLDRRAARRRGVGSAPTGAAHRPRPRPGRRGRRGGGAGGAGRRRQPGAGLPGRRLRGPGGLGKHTRRRSTCRALTECAQLTERAQLTGRAQ